MSGFGSPLKRDHKEVLHDGAGPRVLGHVHLVLQAVQEVVKVLPAVLVVGVGQRHQLYGLTLLHDSAGGAESGEVIGNKLPGDITDLLVREAIDGVHQLVLVDEEGVSFHFGELLIREVRLSVWDEAINVVLPCDGQLNEMHQVLISVADRAGSMTFTTAK